ncbi:DUF6262 family protein [Streptomyces sp. NPDC005148]
MASTLDRTNLLAFNLDQTHRGTPPPQDYLRGSKPVHASGYRQSLRSWLKRCDIRDDHGQPVRLTPHQWRHTLGTRLINRDVPQEVVRRILDHDSHRMTAHYARLSDTTVRQHWEKARKVNISGEAVALDPGGPLADAAWAKQRLGRATQALPNGYCGLPVQQPCRHANACLSCLMFITTPEFLPQHHQQRRQIVQIISAAEARGQQRMVEMNQQVLGNIDRIITALEIDDELDGQEAFEAVARRALVSRSWLYTQPDIRAEIGRLRALDRQKTESSIPSRQRSSDPSLQRRLESANSRNRELAEENTRLRRQLAEALGRLRTAGVHNFDDPAPEPLPHAALR